MLIDSLLCLGACGKKPEANEVNKSKSYIDQSSAAAYMGSCYGLPQRLQTTDPNQVVNIANFREAFSSLPDITGMPAADRGVYNSNYSHVAELQNPNPKIISKDFDSCVTRLKAFSEKVSPSF